MGAPFGEKHGRWKGGRFKKDGYVLVLVKGHPNGDKDGYVREHRLAMETELGRYLTKEEVIHHINGKKDDNRIANLQLFSDKKEHHRWHFTKVLDSTGCKNCPYFKEHLKEIVC